MFSYFFPCSDVPLSVRWRTSSRALLYPKPCGAYLLPCISVPQTVHDRVSPIINSMRRICQAAPLPRPSPAALSQNCVPLYAEQSKKLQHTLNNSLFLAKIRTSSRAASLVLSAFVPVPSELTPLGFSGIGRVPARCG